MPLLNESRRGVPDVPVKLVPPLKWHGGKQYLAQRIIALMPQHIHYVEPYFGGGQVLLKKNPVGISEVANDIYGVLMNFWRVLQNEILFPQLLRRLEAVPFSRPEFDDAQAGLEHTDPIHRAVALFIRCRQSLAGRMQGFTGVTRTRTRRKMNNEVSAWLTTIEGLPAIHSRLKRILILNEPALEVIRKHDGPSTLFYLDPPYLPEARTAPSVYVHEMSLADHQQLLETIKSVKGKVILSSYPSRAYDEALNGWSREVFDVANHASGSKRKGRETEVVWMNY